MEKLPGLLVCFTWTLLKWQTDGKKRNEKYWKTLPRRRQLKFSAYAPTSGQPISSIAVLEEKRERLTEKYQGEEVPCPDTYVGFRLQPEMITFYHFREDAFSEVERYTHEVRGWRREILSP